MSHDNPVPKRLREARLRAQLSQKRLGILAGVDEFSASARINQYERGRHTPDYLTLARLGEVLGVPVPYFYAEDDRLADLILAFARLDAAHRQHLLGVAQGAGHTS